MGSPDARGRRRSRSPSPSTTNSDSSEERHRRKKAKKEKKHKHKSSKHKKHKKHGSEVDEAKLAAAKAFLEQHLQQTAGGAGGSTAAAALAAAAAAGGGGGGSSRPSGSSKREKPAGELPPDVDPITVDEDYFARAAEFTAWLQETKHLYFNELTSQQTHSLFKEFVNAWNGGRLPLRFYTGLAAAPLKRTSHQWGFKGGKAGAAAAGAAAAAAAGGGGRTGMAAYLADQQEQRAEARGAAAADRRHQRKEERELLDELLPRATGGTREARVEARLARREEAKAREESPDRVAGITNILGGDDSFAAAKAREAKRQDWRSKQQAVKKEELAGKLSAAAQAEADKMAQFRALVAAQGGRIAIPKRQ